MLQEIIHQCFPEEKKEEPEKIEKKQNFKLPICYLDEDTIFPLNPVVSNDLELLSGNESSDSRAMYDYLFHPQHQFASDIIPLWNQQYTINSDFLLESQKVVQDISMYKNTMGMKKYIVSHESLMEIWKSTQDDPLFLDKYNYIEWDMFKYLNTNSMFLQSISLANIASPVISFIIPILFIILPFIILKLQGIPISMEIYIDVLRDIAKHHFIGKTLTSMQSLNIQNIAYVIFMFFMYMYQIYQNVVSFTRFYNNIQQINKQLYELKQYLDYSLHSMKTFMTIIENKPTYSKFRMELHNHYTLLCELQKELVNVQPFSPYLYKLTEIGELLRIYYIIHSNIDYSNSLYYSFGFEGYMNNLLGLYENLSLENISKAVFDFSSNTLIEGEYYPPHMGLNYVRNNCDLSKNLIITGPNASGKTTYLKTTIINVIFTQQTGFGFYTSCILNPYTHIHSYLNIPDTSGRDSLFQAESRRCKEILDNIHINDLHCHHLCIFDELYSGTNPEEATKSAYSFLIYLAKNENVDFILTTHYTSICNRMKNTQNIENWKMVVKTKEEDENDIINYTYKIKKGVSKIQGALKVLKEMDYPKEIIESIVKWKEE